MKQLIILPLLLILTQSIGQKRIHQSIPLDEAQQEILEVVLTVFDGMREGDSSKLRSAFRENPALHTSFTDREGKPQLRTDAGLQSFLDAVGTPHDELWDEPLWDVEIRIDGNLAVVWAPYAFYLGKQFSHCGVDAFLLNKDEAGWKIYHLTDTRQREGCAIPDEIRAGRDL